MLISCIVRVAGFLNLTIILNFGYFKRSKITFIWSNGIFYVRKLFWVLLIQNKTTNLIRYLPRPGAPELAEVKERREQVVARVLRRRDGHPVLGLRGEGAAAACGENVSS